MVNHRATAHRCPLVTAFTPCGFSPPEENPTILPHFGFTDAWRGRERRSRDHITTLHGYGVLNIRLLRRPILRLIKSVCLPCPGENPLTVMVLASICVNMNSPPSKSPFRYNRALQKQGVRLSYSDGGGRGHPSSFTLTAAPVVSVRVRRRLLPALVGLGVQQTVVGVDGMAQVSPVVLLA